MCVGEPVCRHVRMCVQCLQRSEEGMVLLEKAVVQRLKLVLKTKFGSFVRAIHTYSSTLSHFTCPNIISF